MKEKMKDGEWLITFTEKDDPEAFASLLNLAKAWDMDPASKAFSYSVGKLIEDKTKEILDCQHKWVCDHAGTMVSRYECTKCGIEQMVNEPPC